MSNINKVEVEDQTMKGLRAITANKADFEHYISDTKAEIYIGVHYL
jgi:hypothetical protein